MIKNLRTLREQKGWSQEVLGILIGVSQQTVGKYETTETQPDLNTLIKMAELFETSVDYLLGTTDIDHKYEYLTKEHLNDDELRIMEKYRETDQYGKKVVEDVLDLSIKNKKIPEPAEKDLE